MIIKPATSSDTSQLKANKPATYQGIDTVLFSVAYSYYNRLYGSNIYYYDFNPKLITIDDLKTHAFAHGLYSTLSKDEAASYIDKAYDRYLEKENIKPASEEEFAVRYMDKHIGKPYKDRSHFVGMLQYTYLDFDHMDDEQAYGRRISAADIANIPAIREHMIALFPSLSQADTTPDNCYAYRMILDRGFHLVNEGMATAFDMGMLIDQAIEHGRGNNMPIVRKDKRNYYLSAIPQLQLLHELPVYDVAKALLFHEANVINAAIKEELSLGKDTVDFNVARPHMHSKHVLGLRKDSFTLYGDGKPLYDLAIDTPAAVDLGGKV